jgi:hypothetical protein
VKEGIVIPRLAERAEGPLRRSTACAKRRASTSRRTLPLRALTELATARSLGALRQPRDDHSP